MDGFNNNDVNLDTSRKSPPLSISASETVATLAAPALTQKRRRPALSCAECRRRKIKCDRNIPCGQCTQSKSPTCTYSPESFAARNTHKARPGSSLPSSVVTEDASRIGEPASRQPQRIAGDVSKYLGLPPWPSPSASDHLSDDNLTGSQSRYPEANNLTGQHAGRVEELVERVHKLEQLLSASAIVDHEDDSTRLSRVPAKGVRGNMAKTRFYGHSHWMHAFAQARKIMCFEFNIGGSGSINLTDRAADIELNALIDKAKVVARKIKATQVPEGPHWSSDYKQFMPPREQADKLVRLYMGTYESIHRILHVPSFHKEYSQFWKSPQSAPTSSTIKILLVLAIGACFYQERDSDTVRGQAQQWTYAAQSWLSSPNEKCRLNTSTIQVQCLLLLARPIYNISGDLVWITAGSVLRAAMNMGFHRDPKYFPRISILHGEVRRRLWATILELNVMSALDSGMPPMISLQDFDTEPPANIDDEDVSEASVIRPVSKPKETFTQTSIQLGVLSSLPIRLEVTRLINDFHYDPTYDEVIRLGGELMKIYNDNHKFFSQEFQGANQDRLKPSPLHRKLLDLRIQQTMLSLHRPFAMMAKTDPRFYYSHRVYLDCSMAVLAHPEHSSYASVPSPDSGELQDDYTRIRLLSGGFLKEVIIHAGLVIYLEIVQPVEDDPSLAFSKELKLQRAAFRLLLQEVLDICGHRIRLSDTNVKAYLLFSIALAHVDALESGKPSEEVIIEAAKNSILRSCKWLEDRLPRPANEGNGNENQQEYDNLSAPGASSDWPGDDIDFAMQDWAMDFTSPETWLFSTWADENSGLEY